MEISKTPWFLTKWGWPIYKVLWVKFGYGGFLPKVTRKMAERSERRIILAKEWNYFGRNCSNPSLNTISITGDCFAIASDIFGAMGLNEHHLAPIFPNGSCPAGDHERWSNLAVLTGKVIRFVHCHGGCEVDITAIYYPNREIKVRRQEGGVSFVPLSV